MKAIVMLVIQECTKISSKLIFLNFISEDTPAININKNYIILVELLTEKYITTTVFLNLTVKDLWQFLLIKYTSEQ